jgi:hypothetical protein
MANDALCFFAFNKPRYQTGGSVASSDEKRCLPIQDVLKVTISSLLLGSGSFNVCPIRLSRRRLARLDLAPLKTS